MGPNEFTWEFLECLGRLKALGVSIIKIEHPGPFVGHKMFWNLRVYPAKLDVYEDQPITMDDPNLNHNYWNYDMIINMWGLFKDDLAAYKLTPKDLIYRLRKKIIDNI